MQNTQQQIDSFYSNNNESQSQQTAATQKYYSILPDLATGWRPRNAQIAAPIFITYQQPFNQMILSNALTTLNRLVYIGPRHDNSYKFHSLTQHSYNVKYGIRCEEVPLKLKKQLEQFTIKSNNRKGLFHGMNPNMEKQLQFQSNFESGNLDIVTKVSANQYNLFLRPDTNTRGHMQWFYFRICNQDYQHKKIRINICNNRKSGVLYCRGMKPYIYSKYVEKTTGVKWQQSGQNISYKKLTQNQSFCEEYSKFCQIQEDQFNKYYCLSFDYTFQSSSDQVYFSYCPPFTYSDMKQSLVSIKKKSNPQNGISIQQQNLCTSLTGLQIPIVTITNEKIEQKDKKCIVITGRFHPGQSNGSHVLKGFMEYLVSPDASYLRDKIIFKIIPMINPDGVVFGNYRTSLSGKDLNRKFKAKNIQLYPQIANLKNFVLKLKRQGNAKLLYFLDFHGHSMKKNAFLYGPQYDIWSVKYDKAKILPKMIASKTDMFRYQSCLFRVAAAKKTTARAFMLSLIPYCYTIQTSVGIHRSFIQKDKQNLYFSIQKWDQLGKTICQSLKQTIAKLEKQNVKSIKKKKKNGQQQQTSDNKQNNQKIVGYNKLKTFQQDNYYNVKQTEINKQEKFQQKQKQNISFQKDKFSFKFKQRQKQNDNSEISRSSSSKSARDKQILRSPSNRTVKNMKSVVLQFSFPQINQVQGQSDRFSEGKSDCQSDDNDFDKEEYKKLSGKIMKFIESFNISVIGERRKNFRMRKNKKKTSSASKTKMLLGFRKVPNSDMSMVPSLKHKMVKNNFSQKKIIVQEKQELSLKLKKFSMHRLDEQKTKNN